MRGIKTKKCAKTKENEINFDFIFRKKKKLKKS